MLKMSIILTLAVISFWLLFHLLKNRTYKLPAMSEEDLQEYLHKQALADNDSQRRAIDREYINKYRKK